MYNRLLNIHVLHCRFARSHDFSLPPGASQTGERPPPLSICFHTFSFSLLLPTINKHVWFPYSNAESYTWVSHHVYSIWGISEQWSQLCRWWCCSSRGTAGEWWAPAEGHLVSIFIFLSCSWEPHPAQLNLTWQEHCGRSEVSLPLNQSRGLMTIF